MNSAPASIHIHLRLDGQTLVLGQGPGGYKWLLIEMDSLQSALRAAKTQRATIQFSRDDPDSNPSKPVERVLARLKGFDLPMQALREPPFPLPAPEN